MLSDDLKAVQDKLTAAQAAGGLSRQDLDAAAASIAQAVADARHLEAAALTAQARAVPEGANVVSLSARRRTAAPAPGGGSAA